MDKQKRVYRAIKSEADRADLNVTVETLFFHDQETGEAIPVLDVLGEEAEYALKKIQGSIRKDAVYAMFYQDTFFDLAKSLSGGEARVMMYFLSEMKYNNIIFRVTLRDVAKKINAGVNTVKDAIGGLKKKGLIIETGTRHNKSIHVNPSVGWKGSWFNRKKKIDMFFVKQEDAITTKRNEERRD